MQNVQIIEKLQSSGKKTFILEDLRKLLLIFNDNTAYKTAERLVKKGILRRLRKGLYENSFNPPSKFEIANALYPPSYISLESALNYYGILIQTPYTITSVCTKRSKTINIGEDEYIFVNLPSRYFFGFEKEKDFNIAQPEKALTDELYLISHNRRDLDLDELDLRKIDWKKIGDFSQSIKSESFHNLLKKVLARSKNA